VPISPELHDGWGKAYFGLRPVGTLPVEEGADDPSSPFSYHMSGCRERSRAGMTRGSRSL
jgi:hypothetical protein